MREDLRKELEKMKAMDTEAAYKYAKSLMNKIAGSKTGHPAALARFSMGLMEAITEYVQASENVDNGEVVKGMLPFLFDAWIIPTLKTAGFEEREVFAMSDDIRKAVMLGAFHAFEKFISDHMSNVKPEQNNEILEDWLGDSGAGRPE